MKNLSKSFLLMVIFLTLIVTACTPETAGTQPNDPSTADSEGDNPKKTDLIIGIEDDAATLLANTDVNYVTDVQIRNIYDPLIERNEQGGYIPGLALDWKNLDDLTWEFTLREGVKFHNGKEFNAQAVKANIDYILDEANNSFYRSRWANVKEAIVIDDYKVQVVTHEPFPTFLERIAGDLLIMEPEHLKEVGAQEAATNPVGTGAYKIGNWSRDEKLELVAFEEYWQGAPEIKKLTFRYIPEFSSRLAAFMSGEIHLFLGIPIDSVETIEKNENAKIASVGSARIQYIALNTFFDGPMKDKRVRQAMNYAIDVDELNDAIMGGNETKITGSLSKVNADYTETKDYGYDPDKAVQLLKEAGYDPKKMSLKIDTSNGHPMDINVVQAIASQLERIGIKASVQMNEWGAFLGNIRQRNMNDMYILSWGPGFEAQSTIENLFMKDAPYSSFYEPEVEEMIKAALPIVDSAERKQAFADIQHRLVEEAAWVPLWQQTDLYAVAKNLKFTPRPDQRYVVRSMSWD
jgi:peptide/nickel transport system substrate-binding protein